MPVQGWGQMHVLMLLPAYPYCLHLCDAKEFMAKYSFFMK